MKTFHLYASAILLQSIIQVASGVSALARAEPPAGYRVAPGWRMEIAAEEPLIVNPVTTTFGPDGRLYVSEWLPGGGPNDRIRVLEDADGDGKFEKASMYMSGLELPAGILFWDGWTYITLDHEVVRFRDDDGDGKFEKRQVVAGGFGNDNSHHRVSGMVIGPDGWLYLTTGDSDAHAKGSDGTTAEVLRCGGVFRCTPEGKRIENVAFGMRNPWGNVGFSDRFEMFHTDNDNEGSAGFTGCRILHVVEKGDYGWRLREGARCCNPDYDRATWNGGRPGRLGWIAETGRGAPAGLCVLNSPGLPENLQNLLVYPDVFRKLVRAYRIKPKGGTYTVDEEFELLGSDDGLFRPNDAEVGPDGALYISDWRTDSGGAGQLSGNAKTGRLYRMTWSGGSEKKTQSPRPRDQIAKLAAANDDQLIQTLGSSDFGLRNAASLEIVRRGIPSAKALRDLSIDTKAPAHARRHALWILALNKPPSDAEIWRIWFKEPDLENRRLAYESASRQYEYGPFVDVLLSTLSDSEEPEPRVLSARLEALGKAGELALKDPAANKRNSQAIAQLPGVFLHVLYPSRKADAFLTNAAIRALESLGEMGAEATAEMVGKGSGEARDAGLIALEGARSPLVISTLLDQAVAKKQFPSDDRTALFQALREQIDRVSPEPIAAWITADKASGERERVAAIRLLAAMGPRANRFGSKVAPSVLEDPQSPAGVRLAAIDLARTYPSEAALRDLLSIVSNPNSQVNERVGAVESLRSYREPAIARALGAAIDGGQTGGLTGVYLAGLAAADYEAAASRAEKLLTHPDREVRIQAIRLLGQKPEQALAVVKSFNSGGIPAEHLSDVIEAIRRHRSPQLQEETQKLLKTKLLAAPTGEDARKLREYVDRRGNPRAGGRIFLDSKKGNCTSCHRLEGVGGSVGPDLTRIWQTLSFEKRLESILEPSKEIKEGYATHKIASKDGKILLGLLVSESPEAVTIRDSEGKEVRVAKSEIEERANDPISLMPVGAAGNLTFQELADLLRFLGDQQAQEDLRKQAK